MNNYVSGSSYYIVNSLNDNIYLQKCSDEDEWQKLLHWPSSLNLAGIRKLTNDWPLFTGLNTLQQLLEEIR